MTLSALPNMDFEAFISADGPRLRAALVSGYGVEAGLDAAAIALAYGWEHWGRIGGMQNPAGYLYRVGQTAAKRAGRPRPCLPVPTPAELPQFEPMLAPALETLTQMQRVCVLMVHGYGWGWTEVADLLDVSTSTVRVHVSRALSQLQHALKVNIHVE